MRITHSTTTQPNQPHPSRCGRGRRILARSTLALVVSAGVLAAAGSAGAEPASVLAVAGSFDEVLNNLRNWLVGILALIATVCLTIGGARYLVCSGDPGEVERAKIALKAACIGYALAMLAPVVVAVLKSIVGG
ncbi:pilin [Nocardia brasiliensis]|uniref:pilin n=1 Tax=Nocardia brasiliensis TaxID=37326 RepID=UPI002454D407|nr:pilin [Nocardia brasiliensis]